MKIDKVAALLSATSFFIVLVLLLSLRQLDAIAAIDWDLVLIGGVVLGLIGAGLGFYIKDVFTLFLGLSPLLMYIGFFAYSIMQPGF